MSSSKAQKDNPSSRRNKRSQSASSASPGASVNMDELRELIALLRENGLAEFELERADFRVRLRREGEPVTPVQYVEQPPAPTVVVTKHTPANTQPTSTAAPAHPGAQAETAASEDQDLHIIPSPIVGTFYRSPAPTRD